MNNGIILHLERIFIEEQNLPNIEEEETWESVIAAIDKGLVPFVSHLKKSSYRRRHFN
ncbi:MAG: hypothetical protein U5K51_14305 [Flavobacteriaceae bacterium]|nr:hypothetical protein [Flavobacteriaceae bacterium]